MWVLYYFVHLMEALVVIILFLYVMHLCIVFFSKKANATLLCSSSLFSIWNRPEAIYLFIFMSTHDYPIFFGFSPFCLPCWLTYCVSNWQIHSFSNSYNIHPPPSFLAQNVFQGERYPKIIYFVLYRFFSIFESSFLCGERGKNIDTKKDWTLNTENYYYINNRCTLRINM